MPKIVDHDAVRAELLDRAFDAFATQGYAALSMRSLARSLDASTGTLYHYFESKQSLFAHMVRRVAQQDVNLALERIPANEDVEVTIEALVGFVHDRDEHLRKLLRMGIDYQRAEPQERDTVRAAVGAFRLVVEQRLAAFDSTAVLRLVIGTLVLRDFDPRGFPLDGLARQIRRMSDEDGPS